MISSSASVSKMSKSFVRLKSSQSASYRYSSPLEYSQPGPFGYRKRAASPARSSSAKRACGGRGRSPSANSQRGFRKWESCPCRLVIGGCLSLHWQVWSNKGVDFWVVEVLRWGYHIPFRVAPTLSEEPIPYPSSIRGKALDWKCSLW